MKPVWIVDDDRSILAVPMVEAPAAWAHATVS